MVQFKKKKKKLSNNAHGVPNDLADEIRALNNADLVPKVSAEYNNWIAAERIKKEDGELARLREELTTFKKEIEADEELRSMREAYDKRKAELVTEEQARIESEIKNAMQPLVEDAKRFKGLFKVAMDEVTRRHQMGTL